MRVLIIHCSSPYYNLGARKVRMELKDFAQYIQNKPLAQLLHRARKESLKRILAREETLRTKR